MIINKYKYNLDVVLQLQKLIALKYQELFVAVIVHGSIATNEVILYSDFDGLLIIKDDYLNSKKLQSFKNESMKIIFKFDPLQHHGWFEISESKLLDYPVSYLPIEVLDNSSLIYPLNDNISLNILVRDNSNFSFGFERLIFTLLNKIENKWEPSNLFELKSFLSQIMLLPCLYFSAKNRKGIFKGESFNKIEKDFNENEWYVIKTSSFIRDKWSYQLNMLQRYFLTSRNQILRKIFIKLFAPKISVEFLNLINFKFYQSLSLLCTKMKNNLK